MVTIFFLTLAQASGARAGPVLLGRLASAMVELDRWAPRHSDDLAEAARDRTRPQVAVEGLPLRLSIPTSVAASGDPEAIRDAIMSAAGQSLWRDGRAAFVDDEGVVAGDISITSPVRWTITTLKQDRNDFWLVATAAAGVASLAIGLLTLFAAPGGFAVVARGALGAGVLCVLAFGAIWALMQALAGAAMAPADIELARIGRDWAWMGLRAGFATGLVGLAGQVAVWTAQRERRYERWPRAADEPA
ncbi:MAG TPA: hypothetical protein VNN10_08800 [Dehalococcoidia bacterium]|nr:hypothetical protein [Dehalococcoidia bacterium]